jgi:hypothetical protein
MSMVTAAPFGHRAVNGSSARLAIRLQGAAEIFRDNPALACNRNAFANE